MNQINLDKLLQTPPLRAGNPAGARGGELKLLVGELYTARLQMLAAGSQIQLQTPQGPLTISLPAQLSQRIGPQLSQQVQVTLSPLANNQLNLTLHTLPTAASSISLSPAQLQPVLSQWLSQSSTSTLTVPLLLELSSGKLQLAGAAANSAVLLTLTSKELDAITQLSQQPHNFGRQPLLLSLAFSQAPGQISLSLQLQGAAGSPSPPFTPASQQQLLQALISQLPPIGLSVAADAAKITLGQLSISIPPPLAAALASNQAIIAAANPAGTVPLMLQLQAPATKSGQWQLVMQLPTQSQHLTISQSQLDRPLSWQAATLKTAAAMSAAASSHAAPLIMPLAPETKAQAWRNLLPLLSQPVMQLNSLPNLPAPLQQLFSHIQQSLPDISKPLAGPAVAAQLNALLQFQPLQSQPNPQTTGGTLALAIQLLLGHLSQKQQTPANNAPAGRLSQLVSQLDAAQAGAALRQLASVSGPLQHSQLATLDAPSQLQQWLLQLPLQQQGQTIMPQLLLEQRDADGKTGEQKQKQWQLTMKFDLQQYGNLLAVAKLQQQDLQLQFYTDHHDALRLAQKFLPLLKDRCAAQGLTVSQAECQLGKIPDSLLPRHTSLLTVKV